MAGYFTQNMGACANCATALCSGRGDEVVGQVHPTFLQDFISASIAPIPLNEWLPTASEGGDICHLCEEETLAMRPVCVVALTRKRYTF